jgi:hypothetical protein
MTRGRLRLTILAEVDFGEGLLFILEFSLLVAWFWIPITIIGDLF